MRQTRKTSVAELEQKDELRQENEESKMVNAARQKEDEESSAEDLLKEQDKQLVAPVQERNNALADEFDKERVKQSQRNAFADQEQQAQRMHEEQVANLKKTMEAHVDQLQSHFRAKLESIQKTHSFEITKLVEENKSKEETLGKLSAELKSLSQALTSLREEKELLQNKLKMELSNQQALQRKLEEKESELEESYANSFAAAALLLQQQESLEKKKAGPSLHFAKTCFSHPLFLSCLCPSSFSDIIITIKVC